MAKDNGILNEVMSSLKSGKAVATSEISNIVSKLVSFKTKKPEDEPESPQEIEDGPPIEANDKADEASEASNEPEPSTEETGETTSEGDTAVDESGSVAYATRETVESSQRIKNILDAVAFEITRLKNTFINLENILYRREQLIEAAAAEAFVENRGDTPAQLQTRSRENRKVSSFMKLLGFTLFALAPVIVGFLRNFDFQRMKKFFENDLETYIKGGITKIYNFVGTGISDLINNDLIKPLKTYLSDFINGVWDSLCDAIQGALSFFITELERSQPQQDGEEDGETISESLLNSLGFDATSLKNDLINFLKGSLEDFQTATQKPAPTPSPSPAPAPAPAPTPSPSPAPSTTPAPAPAPAPTPAPTPAPAPKSEPAPSPTPGEAIPFIPSKPERQPKPTEPTPVPVSPPQVSPPVAAKETPEKKPEEDAKREKQVIEQIPVEGYALLDTIASTESANAPDPYKVIVGSGNFGGPAEATNLNDHPRTAGVGLIRYRDDKGNLRQRWVNLNDPEFIKGRKEKKPGYLVSTAAGRYQFVASTWDIYKRSLEKLLGRTITFSPEDQDLVAWFAAKGVYGPNLEKDLKQGNIVTVGKKLGDVWTSLISGMESRQTEAQLIATYQKNLLERTQQDQSPVVAPVQQAPSSNLEGEKLNEESKKELEAIEKEKEEVEVSIPNQSQSQVPTSMYPGNKSPRDSKPKNSRTTQPKNPAALYEAILLA